MATQPASTSPQGTHQVVTAAPLLAWRILIGVFAFGSAWTLLGNGVRVFRGEAVGPEQFILGVVFLAVGGWLFPQTVTIDATGIQMVRFFGLMRSRIEIQDIDFYWATNMLAIRDYMKGLAGNFDVVERAREERKSGLLINSKKETRRIVLSQYHVGRDRIVEELKRRGVRDYAEAVRQGR